MRDLAYPPSTSFQGTSITRSASLLLSLYSSLPTVFSPVAFALSPLISLFYGCPLFSFRALYTFFSSEPLQTQLSLLWFCFSVLFVFSFLTVDEKGRNAHSAATSGSDFPKRDRSTRRLPIRGSLRLYFTASPCSVVWDNAAISKDLGFLPAIMKGESYAINNSGRGRCIGGPSV